MTDTPVKPSIRRRRIIERPRLIRTLDRSQARVRMLVAPAGYGKTTLAEQWAARDGRQVSWVRARRSAADVAVLARAMAAAGAEILPGCDRRLRERLNATVDPAEELSVLSDLLSEDLAAWPEQAWMVIDDYHHVGESATAEAFVETVVQHSPVRVLISTRDRPRWVSTRSVLYGEVLEIGQSALAMSEDEVDELLAGGRDGMSPGLSALAGGWPAVIGLASLTTSPTSAPVGEFEVPEQLYEFFAEEVYRGLEPAIRLGLGLLATAPSLDRELAAELLGTERAERVCAEAFTLGVLEERGGRLELHPLAAAYLERRARVEAGEELSTTVERALAVYRLRHEWDAAFDIVDRYGLSGLESLIGEALDELLNAARLATVETWADRAIGRGVEAPIISIARGEVKLRHGLHMASQALAMGAITDAQPDHVMHFRALELAARAAHVGSREDEALDLFHRACEAAPSDESKRRALWGQVMCASALELDEAHDMLRFLEESSIGYEPMELVRLADKQLSLGFRFGFVTHLRDARRVVELVRSVDDPFVRCSFRSMYSWALSLGCYYEEALVQAQELLADADKYRVDVAVSHAQAMLGYAHAGLRHFDEAHGALDEAAALARHHNDSFAEQNAYALRIRVLLQEGRALEACGLEPPDVEVAVKGMRGEVMASRALALATIGRLEESLELGEGARSETQAIETRVLWLAIQTVQALKSRDSSLVERAADLVNTAFDAGAVDLLVCAYRANPDLLATLLSAPACVEKALFAFGAGRRSRLCGRAWILVVRPLRPPRITIHAGARSLRPCLRRTSQP